MRLHAYVLMLVTVVSKPIAALDDALETGEAIAISPLPSKA